MNQLFPTLSIVVNKNDSLIIGFYCQSQLLSKPSPLLLNKHTALLHFLLFNTVRFNLSLGFDNINYQTKNVDVDNQRTKVNKHQCKLFIQGQVIINREEYRAHGIK